MHSGRCCGLRRPAVDGYRALLREETPVAGVGGQRSCPESGCVPKRNLGTRGNGLSARVADFAVVAAFVVDCVPAAGAAFVDIRATESAHGEKARASKKSVIQG